MVAIVHPNNSALSYGWQFGEPNWNIGNDVTLKMIGTLLGCQVLDRDLTVPPVSPTDGDRYIVAPGSVGAWLGQDNAIAIQIGGAWEFYGPLAGLPVSVVDEGNAVVTWDGTAYQGAGGASQTTGNLLSPLVNLQLRNRLSIDAAGAGTFVRTSTATATDRYGLRRAALAGVALFQSSGILVEAAATNEAVFSNDLTNAVWVKIDGTAALDQIGRDGVATSASSFTATAANATVLQEVTKAAVENTYSVALRRLVGTGGG